MSCKTKNGTARNLYDSAVIIYPLVKLHSNKREGILRDYIATINVIVIISKEVNMIIIKQIQIVIRTGELGGPLTFMLDWRVGAPPSGWDKGWAFKWTILCWVDGPPSVISDG